MSSDLLPWTYRSVVFDLDGLLVDTEPLFEEAGRRLLARRGLTVVPTVLQAMMGTPAREALHLFRAGHGLSETIDELAAESWDLFFGLLGEAPAPLLPGAVELLDRLGRRGVPLAIATSSSAAYVGRVLGPHELLGRFTFVLTCDDVTCGKPDPEVYLRAAAQLGHEPSAMVVLEDSVNGVRAAKAAGARCVAVPHERVPVAKLAGADAVVPSLADPSLAALLGV